MPERDLEDEVISAWRSEYPDLVPQAPEGPGDDASLIQLSMASGLVSTDQMIEDVHFRRSTVSPHALGYKLLARSASDLAAMAVLPERAWLSWALPSSITTQWLQDFRRGWTDFARKERILLCGGDTAQSPKSIYLCATVWGSTQDQRVLYRRGAQVGDWLGVLGYVGDAHAGWQISEHQKPHDLDANDSQLLKTFLYPSSWIREARWLGQYKGVHAMLDTSDGIFQDAWRLARSNGLALSIDVDKIPLSPEFLHWAKGQERPAWQYAVEGGEDYGLLFAADQSIITKLEADWKKTFPRPLTWIGQFQAGETQVQWNDRDTPVLWKAKSFRHFEDLS